MLELAPEGFEEAERSAGVELAASRTRPARSACWRVLRRGARRRGRGRLGGPLARRSTGRCASGRSGSARRGGRRRPDALAVVIDPGRAFGTGAHPTTRLCLELLLDGRARRACSTSAAARACSRSRRAARLRAGARRRRRGARRRGDASRTPRRTASRSTRGSSAIEDAPATCSDLVVANIALDARARGCRTRIDAEHRWSRPATSLSEQPDLDAATSTSTGARSTAGRPTCTARR